MDRRVSIRDTTAERMDLTALELALRNRQIETVKCFLRIQVQNFRLSLYNLNADCKQNNLQFEQFFSDWNGVFTKVNAIILSTYKDKNSQEFGINLARYVMQSSNQLLIIISEINCERNSFSHSSKFFSLIMTNIRLIRCSLKLQENIYLNTSDMNANYFLKWTIDSKPSEVLKESLLRCATVLSQSWLQKHQYLNKSWDYIAVNAIKLFLSYLREGEIDESYSVLFQLGLPLSQIIYKLYSISISDENREMLLNHFKSHINLTENLKDIIIFLNVLHKSSISLNVNWIIAMGTEYQQKLFISSFFQNNIQYSQNYSPLVIWDYLIDQNDIKRLNYWLCNDENNLDIETFPFNWVVDEKMVQSLYDRASNYVKEILLNMLCDRGRFCLSEMCDFQLILYRLGRVYNCNSINSFDFFNNNRILNSFNANVFAEKLISYSLNCQLYEFMYYLKFILSESTFDSINDSLISLIKSMTICSQSSSKENILSTILKSAQYIYSLPSPVTVKSIIESGNTYLALISFTYYPNNYINSEINNENSDEISLLFSMSNPIVSNTLKTNFPFLFHSFSQLFFEQTTIYDLLKDSVPFDISKLFCWQSLNNSRITDEDMSFVLFNELPHFSHNKLVTMYGPKANLNFTYYLTQGRVIEGFNKFLLNRKKSNSKYIEMACKRAALVAYSDTSNRQVALSCVLFQQLLSDNSMFTSIHLTIANVITCYAADFLGLNAKQQQLELLNLLKKAHYYSEKRCVAKLLQLTDAAFSRKYKNVMNIHIEECFDWKIGVKFAALHGCDFPLEFLIKCAQSDNWLMFTIFCQLYDCPKEKVFIALKQFNNACIADHLNKAFQSSHVILYDNENNHLASKLLNKSETHKSTSSKSLRNAFLTKIGLNNLSEQNNGNKNMSRSPHRSIPFNNIENDNFSVTSETEYNAMETISVFSSSDTSDHEETLKFNADNVPKDLFQIILNYCQLDSLGDSIKPLYYSSIPLSNPILCLIGSSFNYEFTKINIFSVFSCWLLASVDFEIRRQFSEKYSNFDPLNWSLKDNYHMIDMIMRNVNSYFIFIKGIKIFNLNIIAIKDLLNFMMNFFCEKNYYDGKSLKLFQDNIWKYQEPNKLDNIFYSKEWIENASVIILVNALRIANNYELLILLRHYDISRIQETFINKIKIPDFKKLYRLCQCLSSTNISLPIEQLLSINEMNESCFDDSNEYYCSVIRSVVLHLQQNAFYNEAKQFASIAEIHSNEITISEWNLKATANMNLVEFWYNCWDNLVAEDNTLMTALKVLKKHINQVSSVLVKCLLVFKCLHASVQNEIDSKELEIQLWKCVVDVEEDLSHGKNKSNLSDWFKLWNDIINFVKSNRNNDNYDTIGQTKLINSRSKSFDIVIGNLLNHSCLEKAHQICLLFGYNNEDLDITWTCYSIAKGEIKSLSEAPLSVQLKAKANEISAKSTFMSEFTEDQMERIALIECISNLASIGQIACRRILLYYKISCVLCTNFSDIDNIKFAKFNKDIDSDDLKLLKYLIASNLQNSKALNFSKELIVLNKICDEDVATIICTEIVSALKNSSLDISSDYSLSSSENFNSNFLSLIRILNDATILGLKLLKEIENEDMDALILTEICIKAHECFSLSCDVKGIALVLRKARLIITKRLIQEKDFNSILRLMTGIGRYSEMIYCFDIIKESHQFELFLTKRIEKVPQLRIALLDYLKGDKDMYPLVALRFCLYRQIAENHEYNAEKLLREVNVMSNSVNYHEKLETIMFEFIEAQHNYSKADCHTHADSCEKKAQLIALQIHRLTSNIVLINLENNQVSTFIENCSNFYESLIVADAYQQHTLWSNAIFNNVILKSDWNYLSDFKTRLELSASLIEEIIQKYIQIFESTSISNEKLNLYRKSMQKLIQYIEDLEIRFKNAWKLNMLEITNQLSQEENGTYLLDLRRNGYL